MDQVFMTGEGAGRSGSFFFHSFDKRFIIKTISEKEVNKLLEISAEYAHHYETNPNSLLAKILGVFKVKIDTVGVVYLMLMENTLHFESSDNVEFIFDLKGSTVDRKVKGDTNPKTTLKDINFLMASKASESFVQLQKYDKEKVLEAIRKDVRFLRNQRLMDYSLLLGIETTYNMLDLSDRHSSNLLNRKDTRSSLLRQTQKLSLSKSDIKHKSSALEELEMQDFCFN